MDESLCAAAAMFDPLADLVVFMADQIDRYLHAQILCFPAAQYRYHFQWQNRPQPWQRVYGTEHALDVPFVFGNFSKPSFLRYAWTTANQVDRHDLSKRMNSYFANFLWNGNPNRTGNNPHPYSGAPYWDAWTNVIVFNKRMMCNARLGQANAGMASHMSNSEEFSALTDILTLPPIGYSYSKSCLTSFIPQPW